MQRRRTMAERKQCQEKSKYTGITGSEIARILNSNNLKSKEDSRKYVLSHASFSVKRY